MHEATAELTWHQVYEDAITRFRGEPPGVQLESELVELFKHHPAAVQAAITKVADRFDKGQIHSPWAILRRELQQDADRQNTRPADHDREHLIQLAERWIENAGLYCPTEAELIDALTGQHGPLKTWAGDQLLERRLVDRWRHEQPRARQAEADSLERARKLTAARTQPTTDEPVPTEPEQPADQPNEDIFGQPIDALVEVFNEAVALDDAQRAADQDDYQPPKQPASDDIDWGKPQPGATA